MREWRKLYSSVLRNSQLGQVSDEAWAMFFLLIVAQDDTGFYPLDEVKIQTLLATRPSRQRDVNTVLTWCNELEAVGLAKVEDGGITLIKGAEKNGTPRKDVRPFFYERSSHVNVTSTSRQQDVAKSRVEKIRVEESREERGAAIPSPVLPEWFEPLKHLKGYKQGRHTKAIYTIRAACESYAVEAAAVVGMFVLYYPVGQVKHGWTDPVAALARTITTQVDKVLKERDGHGITQSDSDADTWAEAKRLTKQLDAAAGR